MIQILYLLILSMCLSFPVYANDEKLSFLFEDASSEAEKKEEDDNKEGGIFSFLNFSSKQKENEQVKKEKGLETTRNLADAGDVKAQLFMGYSYLYGQNNLPVDYQKAFDYYVKAAIQNNPIALNNLGSLYYSGIGVSRDSNKARVLFTKAASLGNAEAAVNLGFILISGNGASKNPALAIDYFEQASSGNNPAAQFMLGYAYYTGKLRPQDYKKAAPLIKKSADAGFDEAQYILAKMYINGHGFPQNYGLAVNNLQKAVAQGRVDAMMLLGDILADGKKYAKDEYYAHILFNLAAVKNVPGAAERRTFLESKLKIDVVLQAQETANKYTPNLSELSSYVRNTFGDEIRNYIDAI